MVLANILTLRELSFHFEALDAGPVAAFLQLMLGINNNPGLRRLTVQLCQPRSCIELPLLPNMRLLTSLLLTKVLPVHLVSDRLQQLKLGFNGENTLSPPQCLALADLLHGLSALQFLELDLSCNHLDDTMTQRLAAGLRGVPTLRTLCLLLSFTTVTPLGVSQLFEAFSGLPELHGIDICLSGTKAGTAGVHYIAGPVLRDVALSFADTQLDDDGVWALAEALRAIPGLNTLMLDLSETAITDGALVALATLGGVGALTSVRLQLHQTSGITSESLGTFVEAFPQWVEV